jgi:hypothetical protein
MVSARSVDADQMCPLAIRALSPAQFTRGMALGLFAAITQGGPPALHAQTPVPAVSVSYGVDTTIPEVGAIVRVMRAYLAHPDSGGRHNSLWGTRDPRDRRWGDITAPLAYQDAPATILGVVGTDAGDSLYVVKTAYARPDTDQATRLIALQRIYAVREGSDWRLSNTLMRVTRDWQRLHAGRITYWYEPGQRPHPEAVRRAGRFVDSVATLFGVQPPDSLDYYVTSSADSYHRIIGLDFFVTASGPNAELGGLTLLSPGIVLSGDPALGDSYFHELAHAVLGLHQSQNYVVAEGIAVWLGGTRSRSFPEMVAWLRRYQEAHAALRLEDVLRGSAAGGSDADRSDALRTTGAMLVDDVYRRRGAAGLRTLNATAVGPDATLATMRRELPEYASDLDRWWRVSRK